MEIQNLVSFICLDKEDRELCQGVGEAINISCGGIQISTTQPIEAEFILFSSFDLQNDIFDIKGRVIYSRSIGKEGYRSGIEFIDPSELIINHIKQLVKAHQIQKDRVDLFSREHESD